ncbi:MAG: YceI family protein [Chloroherpetonaceae bacterium]|nr:YceI family protein [Chloroherpetonaceae bacterium]MDW8437192.1 YceI family protein [Chloroherpetonaceae bacterium]
MMNILFVGLLACLSLNIETKKVSAIKGESRLTYSLAHPLHNVEATCKEFLCEIEVTEANEIKSARVVADVMNFDSGNSNRDSHAMEVIDAFTYPEVSFASEQITTSGDELHVSGKLTFHGVAKPISFVAKKESQNGKTTIAGKMTVKLADHNVERPKLALIPTDEFLYISFVVVFPL